MSTEEKSLVFSGFGVDILEKSGMFFIRYDAGEISDKIVVVPISSEEAKRAQLSEKDAYEVIISSQNRRK